ncbi:unnamed protein product [Aureobasidium pullulans]|nr:unnamed protein product [Aureobasidium pullulans]
MPYNNTPITPSSEITGTQTQNVVKAEKKPRRNIQYKDVGSAVARVDNLEFLADVVPKTVTYKEHKARKQRDKKEAGQTTLPTVATTATATASDPVPAPVQAQLLDPMDETS